MSHAGVPTERVPGKWDRCESKGEQREDGENVVDRRHFGVLRGDKAPGVLRLCLLQIARFRSVVRCRADVG